MNSATSTTRTGSPGETFSQSLIDSLPASIAVLDGDGVIALANRSWQNFSATAGGLQEPAMPGANYFESCRHAAAKGSEDAAAATAGMEQVLGGERDDFTLDYPCHSPSRQRWFSLYARRLTAPEQGMVVSHVEVTEKNLAEAQFSADLETRNRFFSLASHELRTPLTAVKGYASVLRRMLEREGHGDSAEMAAYIEEDADRMNRMIADMLDVSRIQYGKLEVRREPVDLVEVVTESVEKVAGSLSESQFELKATNESLVVVGDKTRLQQVITNLLTNAARFSASGAAVKVSVERDADRVKVAVLDRGPGIEEEMAPHVFDLFFQGKASGRKSGGLGLGLYIGKNLIEAQGGTMTVESKIREGSTFVVALPLRDATNDGQV